MSQESGSLSAKSRAVEVKKAITRYVETLVETFHKEKAEAGERLNILLLGGTGAGKSTIVNGILGKEVAQTGHGVPVTQAFEEFTREGNHTHIVDSKGLEHGGSVLFMRSVERFLAQPFGKESLKEQIHCVWFVQDITQARVQPFEVEFVKDISKMVPTAVVLNKCDTDPTGQKAKTLSDVWTSALPASDSFIGVYRVVGHRETANNKKCSSCGSRKLLKKFKGGKCTILCKQCGLEVPISGNEGLQELVSKCRASLATFQKCAFHRSRSAIYKKWDTFAMRAIKEHSEAVSFRKYGKSLNEIAAMGRKIAIAWQCHDLLNVAEAIAKEAFSNYRTGRKIPLYIKDFFRRHTSAEDVTIAIGIALSKSFESLKRRVLHLAELTSSQETEATESLEIEITREMIHDIRSRLRDMSVAECLGLEKRRQTHITNSHVLNFYEGPRDRVFSRGV